MMKYAEKYNAARANRKYNKGGYTFISGKRVWMETEQVIMLSAVEMGNFVSCQI